MLVSLRMSNSLQNFPNDNLQNMIDDPSKPYDTNGTC